jgi:hypothetical protein
MQAVVCHSTRRLDANLEDEATISISAKGTHVDSMAPVKRYFHAGAGSREGYGPRPGVPTV